MEKDRLGRGMLCLDNPLLEIIFAEHLKWITTFTIAAHSKAVSSVCILGNSLVSGGSDSTVKNWTLTREGYAGEGP